MIYLFYTSSIILFYTYIGYGIIVKLCTFFIKKTILIPQKDTILPEITHIIACFNEEKIIHKKIENSISLNYPNEKLKTIFVTDGSTDKSMKILSSFPSVINYHTNERKGKLDAINRVIEDIQTEIIVFSDANSFLNKMALRNISIHFQDVSIGAVAGEKKVLSDDKDDAAAAGEGLYWKYESWLKKMDYHLFSVVGAAGELFAIRAKLYQKPNANLLIEDFITSMNVTKNGYRVAYASDAIASEKASVSIEEEIKRKIRISAGGLQAVLHLRGLLNVFRYGVLSFQYISHRVLRWTLAPLALVILFFSNLLLFESTLIFKFFFVCQVFFYLLSIVGYFFKKSRIKFKIAFVPFYFTLMNLSVFIGFYKLISGDFEVTWDKAKRRY